MKLSTSHEVIFEIYNFPSGSCDSISRATMYVIQSLYGAFMSFEKITFLGIFKNLQEMSLQETDIQQLSKLSDRQIKTIDQSHVA